MEGQGVGRTLRLLRNRLPRLRAGQNWIAYFLFGVILLWAVSSWSAPPSFSFACQNPHGPHVIGPRGLPYQFAERVMSPVQLLKWP